MNEVNVRKAVEADIAQIVELNGMLADYHHELDSYWNPGSQTKITFGEYVKSELQKSESNWVVVEHDNRIIGYFTASITRPKPSVREKEVGNISDGFLLKEYRGRGIAKMVAEQFFQWFRERGIKIVELSVDSRNESGVQAWQKIGFREYMKKMKLEL